MKIKLENISKKFRKEWIFKNLSAQFETNDQIAVVGPNGSGKSTLLQAITGILPLNSGKVIFEKDNKIIDEDQVFKSVIVASPYLELIEEFTLSEAVDFHISLRPFDRNFTKDEFFDFVYLTDNKDKQIKFFSSGMKQRLKLGFAFYTKTEVIILDEPTSNLDGKGIEWYRENVEIYSKNKILFIGSNVKAEYDFCAKTIDIQAYK